MKKLISTLLLIVFISTNFSFADTCGNGLECGDKACKAVAGEYICVDKPMVPTTTGGNEITTSPVNGITINEDCLLNGQCKYNIYETLGIRKSVGQDTSVGLFVQDIILSATLFIGTVVTLALIVSGLMYIMAGATGKDPSTAKKGITGSLIGLLIVSSSYLIIRLIQYIAKGM